MLSFPKTPFAMISPLQSTDKLQACKIAQVEKHAERQCINYNKWIDGLSAPNKEGQATSLNGALSSPQH